MPLFEKTVDKKKREAYRKVSAVQTGSLINYKMKLKRG